MLEKERTQDLPRRSRNEAMKATRVSSSHDFPRIGPSSTTNCIMPSERFSTLNCNRTRLRARETENLVPSKVSITRPRGHLAGRHELKRLKRAIPSDGVVDLV